MYSEFVRSQSLLARLSSMKNLQLILWSLTLCLTTVEAFAHGGGLNSKGCHNNRKTGDYHCHKQLNSAVRQPSNLSANIKTLLNRKTLLSTSACPNCYLKGANLGSKNLKGADLRGANLFGADLRRSNLEGADLRGANLRDVNFTATNLKGAKLMGSKLVGARFQGANLKGADLRSAILDDEGREIAFSSGAINLSPRYVKMDTNKIVSNAKPQRSQDVEVGIQAFKNRDYKTAFKKLKQPAEQGNSDAQVYLGYMFLGGYEVQKDTKKAVSFFRKAAEVGNDIGQVELGYQYLVGIGVKKDPKQAYSWFKESEHLFSFHLGVGIRCFGNIYFGFLDIQKYM